MLRRYGVQRLAKARISCAPASRPFGRRKDKTLAALQWQQSARSGADFFDCLNFGGCGVD